MGSVELDLAIYDSIKEKARKYDLLKNGNLVKVVYVQTRYSSQEDKFLSVTELENEIDYVNSESFKKLNKMSTENLKLHMKIGNLKKQLKEAAGFWSFLK